MELIIDFELFLKIFLKEFNIYSYQNYFFILINTNTTLLA